MNGTADMRSPTLRQGEKGKEAPGAERPQVRQAAAPTPVGLGAAVQALQLGAAGLPLGPGPQRGPRDGKAELLQRCIG